MKIKFLILTLFFLNVSYAQNKIRPELKPYTEYLESHHFQSAKDYILEKFKTYDIVILSERDHRDISQYDVIFDVIKDPRFKGSLYTEVGCANMYKRVNDFLLNPNFNETEKSDTLLSIYRDIDFNVVWEKYNYYQLLSTIYDINKTRDEEDKIKLFPLDVVFDWNTLECPAQYKMFDNKMERNSINRDLQMGKHFVTFYDYATKNNPKRNKALVILNTYHGYIRIPKYLPHPSMPNIYSTGEYIHKTYPESSTNIYINYYTQGFSRGLTNNGLFDASFSYTNKDNVGFDLKNTPFGQSNFDLYNFGGTRYEEANFEYIFDGMIFYKPVSEMNFAVGIPNIYPKEFEKQFFERLALVDGISFEESKKENLEYLKEINTIKHSSLHDSIKQKIQRQIDYWIN